MGFPILKKFCIKYSVAIWYVCCLKDLGCSINLEAVSLLFVFDVIYLKLVLCVYVFARLWKKEYKLLNLLVLV